MSEMLHRLGVAQIEPFELGHYLLVLCLTFLMSLPVAWDREAATRTMGLRTFPIVAVASAGFVLVGRATLGDTPGAHARVMQGLMTGIGFLGGGAILKEEDRVYGTATAASIWATAGIGAATAHGRPEIAAVLSALCFALLRFLRPVKDHVQDEAESHEDGDA